MNRLFLEMLSHHDLLKAARVLIIAAVAVAALVAPSLVVAGPYATGP